MRKISWFGINNILISLNFGAPGRIRTHDPQIRSLVLYPAELPVQTKAAAEQPCRSIGSGQSFSSAGRQVKRQ